MDIFWYCVIPLLLSNAYFLYRAWNTLQNVLLAARENQKAIDKILACYELEARAKKLRASLDNPSTELREFLTDLLETGCGIIKIDPSSIFIRSLRKS